MNQDNRDQPATTKFGFSSRGSTAAVEALANAAFPTLPAAAHKPQASLFDLEEVSSALPISTTLLYGVFPIYEKAGKVRTGYMVIDSPSIEIHKSQKDQRADKPAKHFINLKEVFNKEPFQIKDECLSIMVRDDTFYLRPTNSEYSTQNWFEYVLEKCRVMRSINFARPVFREEFFEASWDVVVRARPKLKKDYSKLGKFDDLSLKMSQGRRRLCVQGASVMIFQKDVMPNPHNEVPFERETYVNLPSYVISSFASQENYIILRTGRLSEVGSGELYMRCESYASALAVRDGISDLLRRESERRKAQGIEPQSWISSSNARAMRRRMINAEAAAEGAETRSRLGTTQSQAPSRTVDATDPNIKALKAPPNTRKKSSIAGLLPSFRLKLGSNASAASCASAIDTMAAREPHSPLSNVAPSHLALNARVRNGSSNSVEVAGSSSAAGVPRLATASTSSRTVTGLPQLVCGGFSDDYMPYDPCENKYKRVAFDEASRKGSSSFSGILTNPYSQPTPSGSSAKKPPRGCRKRGSASGDGKDYLEMDVNPDSYTMPPSSLEDSPRSIGSFSASNAPRAYSLGAASRPTPSKSQGRIQPTHQSNDEMHAQRRAAAAAGAVTETDGTPPSSRRTTNSSAILAAAARHTPPTVREEPADENAVDTAADPSESKGQASTLPPTSTPVDIHPDSGDDFSELRKRAHSLGSKSWKKPSFLNIGSKRHGARLNAPSVGSFALPSAVPPGTTGNLSAESRIRTDSGGSSVAGGGVALGRQNSARLSTSTMTASRSTQADDDHVEFDFDGSCPSIESPMNRSRNSSLGVQLPGNMRVALDLALHTHRAARAAATAAERHPDSSLQTRQSAALQSVSSKEEHATHIEISKVSSDADDYVAMEFGVGSSKSVTSGATSALSVHPPPAMTSSYCYAPIDTIPESSDSSVKGDASPQVSTSPASGRRFIVGSDDESTADSSEQTKKERKSKTEESNKSTVKKTRNRAGELSYNALSVVPKSEGPNRESSVTRRLEGISLNEMTTKDRTSSQVAAKCQNSSAADNDDYGMFALEPPKMPRCSTSSASLEACKDLRHNFSASNGSSATSLASGTRTNPASSEALREASFNSSAGSKTSKSSKKEYRKT